jgi:hypothetical protein
MFYSLFEERVMITADQVSHIASILAAAPTWARQALTSSDPRVRNEGADELSAFLLRRLDRAESELAAHFMAKGWSDAWPGFAKKLRCSGTDGCGSSGPSVAWLVDAPPPDHDPTPPKPRLVRTPKKSPIGISQEDWEKAKTDRDRRRLIRIARG